MSDAPSEAEIDAAMRVLEAAREAIREMIVAGTTPDRVAATIGAVLGEAIMRTAHGGEAALIHRAVETAADFLTKHGRPVPLLVGVVDPDSDDAAATQH